MHLASVLCCMPCMASLHCACLGLSHVHLTRMKRASLGCPHAPREAPFAQVQLVQHVRQSAMAPQGGYRRNWRSRPPPPTPRRWAPPTKPHSKGARDGAASRKGAGQTATPTPRQAAPFARPIQICSAPHFCGHNGEGFWETFLNPRQGVSLSFFLSFTTRRLCAHAANTCVCA